MKSKYLMGISVIALGLAMSPAAFADPVTVDLDDTLNGNGAGNDTQTDVSETGYAENSPQTGEENWSGDVLSGNEIDASATFDPDGNGELNDTFQNGGVANNAPQTGAGNVRGNLGSNNMIEDNSVHTEGSALSLNDDVANGEDSSIDNNTADNSSIAANDVGGSAVAGDTALNDDSLIDDSQAMAGHNSANGGGDANENAVAAGEDSQANTEFSDGNVNVGDNSQVNTDSNGNAQADHGSLAVAGGQGGRGGPPPHDDCKVQVCTNDVSSRGKGGNGGDGNTVARNGSIAASGEGTDVAGGDITGEGGIDKNNASGEAVIVNDGGNSEWGEGLDGVNVAGGNVAEEEGVIDNSDSDGAKTLATGESTAIAADDVVILFDTDAVASNTEMSAANVLNVAAANLVIADDDSEATMSSSADVMGMADGVSLGQFSANSGSQGVTEQSQTVTANIGNGAF